MDIVTKRGNSDAKEHIALIQRFMYCSRTVFANLCSQTEKVIDGDNYELIERTSALPRVSIKKASLSVHLERMKLVIYFAILKV